eukprot:1158858-Pelagomonas_calceolata.AAC.12
MDRESPDHYMESFEQAAACLANLAEQWALAALARKYNVHVQSHISECCGEVAFVRHLHPEYATDAAVFDSVGLLDAGRKVRAAPEGTGGRPPLSKAHAILRCLVPILAYPLCVGLAAGGSREEIGGLTHAFVCTQG